MERRSFIKNIGALAIVSQIGIARGAAKKKEVITDLILRSSEAEIKMKLIEIESGPTSDIIHIEADLKDEADMLNAIAKVYFINKAEPIKMVYTPNNNTKLECRGYIVNWNQDTNNVKFEFKVAGLITVM